MSIIKQYADGFHVMGRIVHQFLQMFIHREYLLIITQSKRLIGDNQVVLQVVIELLRVSLECAEDQNIAKLHDRKNTQSNIRMRGDDAKSRPE